MTIRTVTFGMLLAAAAAITSYAGQANTQPPSKESASKPADPVKPAADSSSKKIVPQPTTSPASAGATVFVDPATGQIRQPEASEIGALAAQGTTAPPTAPVVIQGPGGAVGIKLTDDFLNYVTIHKDSDGRLVVTETSGAKTAATKTPTETPGKSLPPDPVPQR